MIIDMKHLNLNNSGFFSAKGRRSRGVRAARTLMWSAFMVPLLLMGACEDDPEDYRQIPVPSYPEVSLPTYMTVAVEASKDVDITRQGRFDMPSARPARTLSSYWTSWPALSMPIHAC